MTSDIKAILASDIKHKEKVIQITDLVKRDRSLVADLIELLKTGSDVEKGTAAEVTKFVSKDNPEFILPYSDVLIQYIDYKAPKVRWGCPESIGNLAKEHSEHVEKAIPKLFKNLEDKSTVVRWCAAYALTEIAKYSFGKQKELVAEFKNIIEKEQNNGVKQVFLKALKEIDQ